MNVLIFLLLLFFVGAQVYVEAINESSSCRWWRESMSHYLGEVKHSSVQVLAYLGFAVAEVLMIFAYPHTTASAVWLAIAAAGLIGVALTGAAPEDFKWHQQTQKLHNVASGLAFGGAYLALGLYLLHTPMIWLLLGGVSAAVAFGKYAPEKGALMEKAVAACVTAAFVTIVGVPL